MKGLSSLGPSFGARRASCASRRSGGAGGILPGPTLSLSVLPTLWAAAAVLPSSLSSVEPESRLDVPAQWGAQHPSWKSAQEEAPETGKRAAAPLPPALCLATPLLASTGRGGGEAAAAAQALGQGWPPFPGLGLPPLPKQKCQEAVWAPSVALPWGGELARPRPAPTRAPLSLGTARQPDCGSPCLRMSTES